MAKKGGILSGGLDPFKAPSAPQIPIATQGIRSIRYMLTGEKILSTPNPITTYGTNAIGPSGDSVSSVSTTIGPKTAEFASGTGTGSAYASGSNEFGASKRSEITTADVYDGGALYAFGDATAGILGNEGTATSFDRSSPVQIGALTNWKDVAGGDDHSLAIDQDGALWSWGNGLYGVLGHGNVISRSSPVQVGALTNWKKVDAGNDMSMALKDDGTLWAWGNDLAIYRSSPVQVGSDTDWVDFSCGNLMAIAQKENGTVWTWGTNTDGQLGLGFTGTGAHSSSPTQIGKLWSTIPYLGSDSHDHTFAIDDQGHLYGWGGNDPWGHGARGSNSTTRYLDLGLIDDSVWYRVSTNNQNTLALKADGTLWAAGFYKPGGWGSNTGRSTMTQIGALTNWADISGGHEHTGAIKQDGTLWMWGEGSFGRTGLLSQVDRNSPVQAGSDTQWVKVHCGRVHTLGLQGVS